MSDCCFSVAFSSIQLFVVWSQILLWTWLALIGFSVEQQSYVGKDLLTPLSLFSCLKSDSFSGSLKYWFFKCTVMDSVPPICSFILQMISWADTKLFWCDLTLNSDFFFFIYMRQYCWMSEGKGQRFECLSWGQGRHVLTDQ